MCCMVLATGLGGREDSRAPLTKNIHDLGTKLRLFDVRPTEDMVLANLKLPQSDILQLAHIAWGTYAWLTLDQILMVLWFSADGS
jgi:hypothetical protein